MSIDARPQATTASAHGEVGRLADNIGFLAARFTYLSAKTANRALAPFALTIRLYTVLELAAAGEGMSQRELGRILCVDPSNVLRLVDQLADRGLVARVRDTVDRRRTIIRATEDGRDLATAAAAAIDRASADLLAPLDPDERADAARLLRRLGLDLDAPAS